MQVEAIEQVKAQLDRLKDQALLRLGNYLMRTH